MDAAQNANTISTVSESTAGDHVRVNSQDATSSSLALPAMSSNPLPVDLYESLLLKLVTVLELTHQLEGTTTPAAKQKLLQAVSLELLLTYLIR